MLFKTALRIVVHEKEKFGGAITGVALAIFLLLLQWSFNLGYKRDITVVQDCVRADIWIVPKNQPMFDCWMSMDDPAVSPSHRIGAPQQVLQALLVVSVGERVVRRPAVVDQRARIIQTQDVLGVVAAPVWA
jgi:hypothetical protein